ncbi:MAG: radical SAM protein [bacterium]
MAGGFGTTFDIGNSPGARLLEALKKCIANVPDIGMAYLTAVLRRAGHETALLYNAISPGFDLYLVQSSIVECANEKKTASELLRNGCGRVGVWGRFASEAPEYFLNDCHFVIRGEPEALNPGRLEDRDLCGISDAGVVEDLNRLPFPDWDGFPLHLYKYRITRSRGVTLPVAASRGCPFNCHYCPYKVNNPFRTREPEGVIEEIERLRRKYGVAGVVFRDPDFTAVPGRTHQLLERIIRKGLNRISYYIEGRTDNVDEETVKLMSRAGINSWEIGIETSAHDTLRRHGRTPPGMEHQIQVVNWCRKRGIRVVGNYMIGFPEDTGESILSVLETAIKINTFAVQFTVCTPYPGTRFFEEVRNQLTTDRWEDFTGWNNVFRHSNLSSGRIARLREYAYVKYHFRLKYLVEFFTMLLRGMLRKRRARLFSLPAAL